VRSVVASCARADSSVRGALGELRSQLCRIELGDRLANGDAVAFTHEDTLDLADSLARTVACDTASTLPGTVSSTASRFGCQPHDVSLGELQRWPLALLGNIVRRRS